MRIHFPAQAKEMDKIPLKYRPFGLFSFVTINTKCSDVFHLDKTDAYIAAVLPLGPFTKAPLAFSDFNASFDIVMGDLAIFFGNVLYHQAEKYLFSLF